MITLFDDDDDDDKTTDLEKASDEVSSCANCTDLIYSNVGLGSSLRGEPGLTTFRSQGCP